MNLIRLLTCTEHHCRADKADPVWLLCLSRLTDWNNQKVNHIHTHAQSFAYLFKNLFHTRRGQVPNKKPSTFLSHISYQLSKQWRELKHRCQPGKITCGPHPSLSTKWFLRAVPVPMHSFCWLSKCHGQHLFAPMVTKEPLNSSLQKSKKRTI